jgi:hypothetical protein
MMDPVVLMLMVNQSVLVTVNGQDVIVQVSINSVLIFGNPSLCTCLYIKVIQMLDFKMYSIKRSIDIYSKEKQHGHSNKYIGADV